MIHWALWRSSIGPGWAGPFFTEEAARRHIGQVTDKSGGWQVVSGRIAASYQPPDRSIIEGNPPASMAAAS
jgi:hypothetical protein